MITDSAAAAGIPNKELSGAPGDSSEGIVVPPGAVATELVQGSVQFVTPNFSELMAHMQKLESMVADQAAAHVLLPTGAEVPAWPATNDPAEVWAEEPVVGEGSIDGQATREPSVVTTAGPPVTTLDLARLFQLFGRPESLALASVVSHSAEQVTSPRSEPVSTLNSVQASSATPSGTAPPVTTAAVRDAAGIAVESAMAALALLHSEPSFQGAERRSRAESADALRVVDAANNRNDWSGALQPGGQNVVRSDAVVAAVAGMQLSAPLGTDAWREQLGNQVNWLVGRGEQSATLSLSPAHLGPVEVRLAVREGEASVMFGAAQAETRHALEAAMPRLREMLASSGIALTNAGVSQHAPQDPRAFTPHRPAGTRQLIEPVESAALRGRTAAGLLDIYA